MTLDLTMSNDVAAITHSGSTSLTVSSTSGTVAVESVVFTGGDVTGMNTLTVDGVIVGAGNTALSSDARLKEDVATIAGATTLVAALRGVRFSWRPDAAGAGQRASPRDVGFIAQEVEAVLPELVFSRGDGFKAVAYQGVIPVLVEAFREQLAAAEVLRAKVARQEAAAGDLLATVKWQEAALAGLLVTVHRQEATAASQEAAAARQEAAAADFRATVQRREAAADDLCATVEAQVADLRATVQRQEAALAALLAAFEGQRAAFEGQRAMIEGLQQATYCDDNTGGFDVACKWRG
ncbi:hypothetical protein M885DRAFT_553436 [Pelagophyceae sp. CCMP2097]|nr:hypothetical protein M885DRAFT_553436 [Pelagophyceae sp. CCMP2097]